MNSYEGEDLEGIDIEDNSLSSVLSLLVEVLILLTLSHRIFKGAIQNIDALAAEFKQSTGGV